MAYTANIFRPAICTGFHRIYVMKLLIVRLRTAGLNRGRERALTRRRVAETRADNVRLAFAPAKQVAGGPGQQV